VRAHRGWGQAGGLVGAGAAGLLVIAGCTGTGPGAQPPPAKVIIVSGNLTFSSAAGAAGHPAAGAAGHPAAPAHQPLDQRAGNAIVGGLNSPGSDETTPGGIGQAGAVQAVSGRSRASGGPAVPVDLRPDLGVRVAVRDGRLTGVSVRPEAGNTVAGNTVAGSYAPGSRTWRTRWALAPSRTYRVTVTAVGSAGQRTVMASDFQTLRPRRSFAAATVLGAGETVGVGMPIMINFTRPIADKAAVERALQIWSSKPVTGAWYWVNSKSVWFRPRHYWPAHARVRFSAHLAGLQGAPGVYGKSDLAQHFRIGDSLIAVASAATHQMKVWWNGRLAGDWPVSTGRPGMDTPDGRYLSFAKGSPVDMNSASYGVGPGMPGYYNELVYDAVQFTFSGDYVHSAPWSVGEQGVSNVSHGCVNLAPGYAAWFYSHSALGDPISVVGSPVTGTWGDGWTIYFLGWRKLLAGSATGDAVLVSRDGSRLVAAASASR
jgi:lipoprotein-anchoring transpeptidase ErfK/SrfK